MSFCLSPTFYRRNFYVVCIVYQLTLWKIELVCPVCCIHFRTLRKSMNPSPNYGLNSRAALVDNQFRILTMLNSKPETTTVTSDLVRLWLYFTQGKNCTNKVMYVKILKCSGLDQEKIKRIF